MPSSHSVPHTSLLNARLVRSDGWICRMRMQPKVFSQRLILSRPFFFLPVSGAEWCSICHHSSFGSSRPSTIASALDQC